MSWGWGVYRESWRENSCTFPNSLPCSLAPPDSWELWLGEGGLLSFFPQQNLLPGNAPRQVCFHLGTGPLVLQWPSALLDPY